MRVKSASQKIPFFGRFHTQKKADSCFKAVRNKPQARIRLVTFFSISYSVRLHVRELFIMSSLLLSPFSPPGVAVVHVTAPASLSPEPSASTRRARVAIYTGMAAQELALVVKSVLALPADAECTGFLVIDVARQANSKKKNTSRHKHHSHHQAGGSSSSDAPFQRIVPLSLACIAPDLLTTVRHACVAQVFRVCVC